MIAAAPVVHQHSSLATTTMPVPIRAANQHVEANVQEDTCNSKTHPETLYAHVEPECKAQSQGHANKIVAD